MKALLLRKIGDASLSEIPVPKPGLNEKLVRVAACGLCRTDAKMWTNGQRDMALPRILGHEICGVDIRSGRRVVIWPGAACGDCDACRTRHENLCSSIQILGFNHDGGLAEYVVAPSSSLIPIPDTLPSVTATLTEPLGSAVNAIKKLHLCQGQKLLVFGGGPLGLILAFAATKISGASTSVVEPSLPRRKLAKRFLQSFGSEIFPATPKNIMFDAAINATSSPDSLICGIRKIRAGGAFCLFSGFPTDTDSITSDVINEIHYRELRLCGAYGCTRSQMRRALVLLSNHVDLADQLVSGVLPLEKTVCGLRNILERKGMKWVVSMNYKNGRITSDR